MRDLIVSLILLSLMPAAFRRPFVGMLAFSWLAYMRVQDLTWGFARGMRWSYYFAIVMFVGYVVNGGSKFFSNDVRCYLMIGLIIVVSTGVAMSEKPDALQFNKLAEFLKVIGIAMFTTVVVRTREHLRIMMWVVALSLGFFGVKSGLWGILTFGSGMIKQGPGGMLADNNDFALALAMAVPLLFNIGLSEKKELLRKAFFITVPLTMMTVGLTHSRGGFLSLSGVLSVLIWRSRNRVAGMAIGFLIACAAVIAAPSSLKTRIGSIANYEEDSSAQARFGSWAVAIRMASDNPIFGVGLGKFRQHYLDYEPNPTAQQLSGKAIYVAHNSYLQIWAECGTPAFLMYLTLIGATFMTLWKVRRRAKQLYYSSWIINYATAFEASFVGFMIGSTFLNRAHFDLFYHFVALVYCFGQIAMHEMEAPTRVPRRTGRKRGRGELRSIAPGGFAPRPKQQGFRNTPLLPGEA